MELTTCSALCNLPTVWAEKSSPDGPFSSRPFPLQPYAADWSGPFLFLGEVLPERKQHEKPLTDCTVRRRHSPLNWERLCFQRPCPPHHGNLGGFYGGCHLDLFPCHLVLLSRFPVGSSARINAGSFISALPMDTLCC